MYSHQLKKFSGLLVFAFIAALLIMPTVQAQGPQALIKKLVLGSDGERTGAINGLKVFPTDSLITWIGNFKDYTDPNPKNKVIERFKIIDDTVKAPYYIIKPPNFNPKKPTPLIIQLHGGVSRPEYRDVDPKDFLESPIFKICQEEGWIGVYPLGKLNHTWWDQAGMEHIIAMIRDLKYTFNIDDDKVFMCGFSDGASGSFHFGMLNPNDFAAFFPWSGHLAVGSLVSQTPVYAPNLANRLSFATAGGLDQLYPTKRMLPLIETAIQSGADLWFTSYDTATHTFGYSVYELPLFHQRVKQITRQPFRPKIYWETFDLKYNRVDWIEITAIDTTLEASSWHKDYNVTLTDDRLSIGFNHDDEYTGSGVKVRQVGQDENYPAFQMGLRAGDVIIYLDDTPTPDISSLAQARDVKSRGDEFSVTVIRNEETMTLFGKFPPPYQYPAFVRKGASAAVRGFRMGNRFELETSHVSGLTIYLHPEMVRFDQPIEVFVNNIKLFEGMVNPDSELLLNNYLINRDRRALWVGKIELNIAR